MLFKRTPPQTPQQIRTLEWDNPDRRSQSLWIAVQDWQYKVFPSRQSHSIGSWMFQFEGHCGAGPMKDLTATGEVEMLKRDEVPGMLSDHWKLVPENVEGYAFLTEHDDRAIQPSFGVTLYCQESALDWIYRAFSVAAFSRSGGVGLELQLQCPNNAGGPFWKQQWRKEWLLVPSWKVFAGTQLRPPQ